MNTVATIIAAHRTTNIQYEHSMGVLEVQLTQIPQRIFILLSLVQPTVIDTHVHIITKPMNVLCLSVCLSVCELKGSDMHVTGTAYMTVTATDSKCNKETTDSHELCDTVSQVDKEDDLDYDEEE